MCPSEALAGSPGRAGVFHALSDWTQLQTVARRLCDARQLDPQWPMSVALATSLLEGPERAIGILMDMIQAFSDASGAYHDLACCDAVLGNVDLARGWHKEAFQLDAGYRDKARVDPDLAALRTES